MRRMKILFWCEGARAKRRVVDRFGFETYAAKHLEWYAAAAGVPLPGFGLN
jgi:hypothetical protein